MADDSLARSVGAWKAPRLVPLSGAGRSDKLNPTLSEFTPLPPDARAGERYGPGS
jgi:hypothetical protein